MVIILAANTKLDQLNQTHKNTRQKQQLYPPEKGEKRHIHRRNPTLPETKKKTKQIQAHTHTQNGVRFQMIYAKHVELFLCYYANGAEQPK